MQKSGEILRNFRKNKKITMVKLAELLDCSQQFVTQLEVGNRKFSNEKLEILKKLMSDEEFNELINAIAYERIKDLPQLEVLNKDNIQSYKIRFYSDIQASAGHGAYNEENEDDEEQEYIEVPANLKNAYNIAIKITGDSMEPEFKQDDIIIIDTLKTKINYDKYFVVNYDDFVYLKKIIKKDDNIYLHSVNPYYPDILIKDLDKLKVIGKVITVLRNY